MRHLDDRVSDLVDNRLDHDERDRALAHLASCEQCREAAEMERYAKGALTSLPAVDVPAALTEKLLALAEPAGPLPVDSTVADPDVAVAEWGASRSAGDTGSRHGTTPTAGAQQVHHRFVDRHRKGVRVAAGGMVSTGALLVMLASLGAPSTGREQDPVSVVPPVEEFTAEYARSTGGLPFAEPASILVPALSRDATDAAAPSTGLGTTSFGSGTFEMPGASGEDGR